MTAPRSVSITIPVFNEEAVLAGSVARLLEALEPTGIPFEVILAENGSSDGTPALAKELALRDSRVRVLHWDRPDYGRAMRQGFLVSSGDCLLNFSIDFIDVGFLRAALARLASFDVVLGSKYVAP
ncbi:MAG: glycosyltransferase family 2 protein, partial [Chloroflexota bacterium]